MVKEVLWTGGWDSTFRVIQLFKRGIQVQPIYVIDKERKSTNKEISVMETLTQMIKRDIYTDTGDILPLRFIQKKDIPFNLYLKIIYKLIKRKRRIGSQYYWLAVLAKSVKGLEQGFHKEDRDCLIYFHELKEVIDETGGRNWIANPKTMSFLKRQLFKDIKFPLAYISKIGMKLYAEENGFIDIMDNTWFCHNSSSKPCGKCNPCRQYVIDGLGYRLQGN